MALPGGSIGLEIGLWVQGSRLRIALNLVHGDSLDASINECARGEVTPRAIATREIRWGSLLAGRRRDLCQRVLGALCAVAQGPGILQRVKRDDLRPALDTVLMTPNRHHEDRGSGAYQLPQIVAELGSKKTR